MYEFIDLSEKPSENRLPSVAMEYNGLILEDEIKGYTTLKVQGREMLNTTIETENPLGRDGSLIVGQTLPSREITVTYMLQAESNEAFQYKYSLLMRKLFVKEDVAFRFFDQSDITFYGRYSNHDEIDGDSNWVVSSFTLFCQDPYKYEKKITLTDEPLTMHLLVDYEVKPEEIKIIVGSSATKITIDNNGTGRHIILNGSYASGDTIKIRLADNSITKNGQNIMNNLDYMESDFHSFLINKSDTINVTPNSELSITLRGRTL